MKICHAELSSNEKELLIKSFYEMYFNTGQDVEEFATEFYFLVGTILRGDIPFELEKLSNEFIDIIVDKVPRLKKFFDYKEKYFIEEDEA